MSSISGTVATCDLLLLKNIMEGWKERRKIMLEWSAMAISLKALGAKLRSLNFLPQMREPLRIFSPAERQSHLHFG